MSRALRVLLIAFAACGGGQKDSNAPLVGVSDGKPKLSSSMSFAFDSLDDRLITSDSARGKRTVIAFITTWDAASQAQMNFLAAMAKTDGNKVFYAAVAIEDAGNRALVRAYVHTLKIEFPVAHVDRAGLSASGAFSDVQEVPTTVVLDERGVLLGRKSGLLKPDVIRAILAK